MAKQLRAKRKFVQAVNVRGSVSLEHVDFCSCISILCGQRIKLQKSSSWPDWHSHRHCHRLCGRAVSIVLFWFPSACSFVFLL